MAQTELAALCIVAVLIVFDYASGLLKAIMQHDVSSTKMRDGLWHKCGFVLVMALAEIIEHAQVYLDLGYTVPLVVPAGVYIALTEISSILENLSEINPEIAGSPLLQLFRTKKAADDDTAPKHKA